MKKLIKCKGYSVGMPSEEKIKALKEALQGLKEEIAILDDFRSSWTDFDVAVICWILTHDEEEANFWKNIELSEKIQGNDMKF